MISAVLLVLFAPQLARIGLEFQPWDFFMLVIFALTVTASLAGEDAGAQALLDHLGIARVSNLPTFLETLKLFHLGRPLPSRKITSISCSGGEASLIADMAHETRLSFPACFANIRGIHRGD